MTATLTTLAARPVHAASAIRISFLTLGVIASLAVGKAMLAQGLASPAMAETISPTAVATNAEPMTAVADNSGRDVCRQVQVEIDEGYGVRGQVTRVVCRKVF